MHRKCRWEHWLKLYSFIKKKVYVKEKLYHTMIYNMINNVEWITFEIKTVKKPYI